MSNPLNAQSKKYVKDIQTGKVYYTPTTISTSGGIEFYVHPDFEVDPPTTEPAERLVSGGPRLTTKVTMVLNGVNVDVYVTHCYNSHWWPCAWCSNSLN
jgi:hypothetical protein